MTETPTNAEFRAAGFTPDAALYPRSEFSFRLLCAFNGMRPELAPNSWRYYPNESTRDAWERVADAAADYLRGAWQAGDA